MKRLALLSLLILTLNANAQEEVPIREPGDPLQQPDSIDSINGIVNTTISIQYSSFAGPFFKFEDTRLLNGQLPGPTLRVNPGDQVRILYKNELEFQPNATRGLHNRIQEPDRSNLHYHGGHVSGASPSDDIRESIGPGEEFQYITDFPANHMPGTHWMHPHSHGASALQVSGGAAMALIVNDPEGFLPDAVASAKDSLIFVQHFNPRFYPFVLGQSNDQKMKFALTGEPPSEDILMVNGQYQPVLSMQPREWQRLRIVWASFLGDMLDAHFSDPTKCEMQLLAKDGIYIQDFPRAIDVASIPVSGRADIMVRCSEAGSYDVLDWKEFPIFTVNVTGEPVESSDLTPWAPEYPTYLTDLISTPASEGCTCETAFQDLNPFVVAINGQLWDKNKYLHTVKFGSVVERHIVGINEHPYHQHVYPFQLVSGVDELFDADENLYFKTGDWHDVISFNQSAPVGVRYTANVFDGPVILHCHVLPHEDMGTMNQELVVMDGECQCNVDADSGATGDMGGGMTDMGGSMGGNMTDGSEMEQPTETTTNVTGTTETEAPEMTEGTGSGEEAPAEEPTETTEAEAPEMTEGTESGEETPAEEPAPETTTNVTETTETEAPETTEEMESEEEAPAEEPTETTTDGSETEEPETAEEMESEEEAPAEEPTETTTDSSETEAPEATEGTESEEEAPAEEPDAETEISPDPEESSGEIVSPDVEEEESSVDDSSSSSLSVMVASIMSLWGVFCILIQ